MPAVKSLRICGVVDRSGYVFDAGGIPASTTLVELRGAQGERATAGRSFDAARRRPRSSVGGDRRGAELWRSDSRRRHRRRHRDVARDRARRGFDRRPREQGAARRRSRRPIGASSWTARRNGRRILHEATVGAGLPVIDTLRKLQEAGDEVLASRAVRRGHWAICSARWDAATVLGGAAERDRDAATPSRTRASISRGSTSRARR